MQKSRRNKTSFDTTCPQFLELVSDLHRQFEENRQGRALSDMQREECFKNFKTLLLDLYSAATASADLYIGYSRGKKSYIKGGSYWNNQYDQPLLSFAFYLGAIDFLSDIGLIENQIAKQGASEFSSRMKATKHLSEAFNSIDFNWANIVRREDEPNIIVRDENRNSIPFPNPNGFPLEAALSNVERINENLRRTMLNLNVSDEDLSTIGNLQDEDFRETVEFANRSICRIFGNSSFGFGGRFYGGWWQSVPQRFRKFIEIDGAVTVEMDYSTVQPRILYARAGIDAPEDSYSLPDWDDELRPVIKKAFNQLINSKQAMASPKRWKLFAPDIVPPIAAAEWEAMGQFKKDRIRLDYFNEIHGRCYEDLLQSLYEFHKPIEFAFFSQAYGEMQNVDSIIAESVIISLLDQDVPITALPIHDSFIVRRGAEDKLHEAMEHSFKQIVGVDCKIDRDEAVYDVPEIEGRRIVFGEDLHEGVRQNLVTHSLYHLREREWQMVYGEID